MTHGPPAICAENTKVKSWWLSKQLAAQYEWYNGADLRMLYVELSGWVVADDALYIVSDIGLHYPTVECRTGMTTLMKTHTYRLYTAQCFNIILIIVRGGPQQQNFKLLISRFSKHKQVCASQNVFNDNAYILQSTYCTTGFEVSIGNSQLCTGLQ